MTERERSARVELARLARAAALAVDGVESVGPRPRAERGTEAGGERIEGVLAAAEGDGRYGVTVYVGAAAVALRELAERVRDEVEAAAAGAGLADEIGTIDVVVDDLVDSGVAR